MPELGWGLITIVGVIAMLIVFIFVIQKNKAKDSASDIAHTEKATHDLYEEEHAAAERREHKD